jgi:hypothetical protein
LQLRLGSPVDALQKIYSAIPRLQQLISGSDACSKQLSPPVADAPEMAAIGERIERCKPLALNQQVAGMT